MQSFLTRLSQVSGYINVLDYGADATGVLDCTTLIQNAVNDIQNSGGGVIFFPKGLYLINETVRISSSNVVIKGSGYSTTIYKGSSVNDLFYFKQLTAPVNQDVPGLYGCGVTDLQIQQSPGSIAHTGGYAVHSYYTQNFVLANLRIGLSNLSGITSPIIYSGFNLEYTGPFLIDNIMLNVIMNGTAVTGSGPLGGPIAAGPSGSTSYAYDGVIRGCVYYGSYQAGSSGFHIGGGTGGVTISHTDIGIFETSILVDASTGETNRELFLGPACFCDSAGNHGLQVSANSLKLLHWNDVWAAGCGRSTSYMTGFPNGNGINIDQPQASDFHAVINGGRIYSCQGGGIQASAGTITINGLQIHNNGLGSGGGDGIAFLGGSKNTGAVVSGCHIHNNGNGSRGTGILTSTGMNKYCITGNVVTDNGIASINDVANGAIKSITGNATN